MRLNGPAARVGISNANLSYLKTGKVRAVRFSTLDTICGALKCRSGDLLEYVEAEQGTVPAGAPSKRLSEARRNHTKT